MKLFMRKTILPDGTVVYPMKKKRDKKKRVLMNITEILPFQRINHGVIHLKKGVMDILKITTRDLYTLTEEELQHMLLAESAFLRSYTAPFKVIALNFPSRVDEQKQYWLKKKEATTNEIRNQFIERKLFEFDFLERERTNREFFLFVYAEDQSQLDERKALIIRSKQQSFPIQEISSEKKKDILFMLNNLGTKL